MSEYYESLDHVQLAAPQGSEQEAIDFYHRKLLFTEVEKPEALKKNGGVWFQAGAVHLHIGIEPEFVPAKKAHPAFKMRNLKAFKKHLDQTGVTYKTDTRLPGASRIYVSDPFGNRLEFLEWV